MRLNNTKDNFVNHLERIVRSGLNLEFYGPKNKQKI